MLSTWPARLRSEIDGSAAGSALRIALQASSSPVARSVTTRTTPLPPLPSSRPHSYLASMPLSYPNSTTWRDRQPLPPAEGGVAVASAAAADALPAAAAVPVEPKRPAPRGGPTASGRDRPAASMPLTTGTAILDVLPYPRRPCVGAQGRCALLWPPWPAWTSVRGSITCFIELVDGTSTHAALRGLPQACGEPGIENVLRCLVVGSCVFIWCAWLVCYS